MANDPEPRGELDADPPGANTPVGLLGYRAGRDDATKLDTGLILSVAMLAGGALFASVPLAMIAAYNEQSNWPLLLVPGMLLALIAAATLLHRRPRGRPVALGIWLGVGLASLAQGLCFGLVAAS